VPLGDQCLSGKCASGGNVPLGNLCRWGVCAAGEFLPLGGEGFLPYFTSSWTSTRRLLRPTHHPLLLTCGVHVYTRCDKSPFLGAERNGAFGGPWPSGATVESVPLWLFWRWGVIVALTGCDASRERCPCLQWPVDPLGELHSGVSAPPRRSEGGVVMSSWP
jgi:hypothetical protein